MEIHDHIQDNRSASAITAMREWEWLLGYDAKDPFSDMPTVAISSSATMGASVPLPEFGPSSLNNEVDLLDLNDMEEDNNPLGLPDSNQGKEMPCRHSVSFCSDYVARLDELVDEVREALSNVSNPHKILLRVISFFSYSLHTYSDILPYVTYLSLT